MTPREQTLYKIPTYSYSIDCECGWSTGQHESDTPGGGKAAAEQEYAAHLPNCPSEKARAGA